MPLEIREIGIRMEVGGDSGQDSSPEDQGSGALALIEEHDRGGEDPDRAELIEQCVAAVLAELSRRSER